MTFDYVFVGEDQKIPCLCCYYEFHAATTTLFIISNDSSIACSFEHAKKTIGVCRWCSYHWRCHHSLLPWRKFCWSRSLQLRLLSHQLHRKFFLCRLDRLRTKCQLRANCRVCRCCCCNKLFMLPFWALLLRLLLTWQKAIRCWRLVERLIRACSSY